MIRRLSALVLALFVAVSPVHAAGEDVRAVFTALRDLDMRVAAVAERLAIANVKLCTATTARTGLVLYDLAQYTPETREDAKAVFGFGGSIVVAGVVEGSASARAGVRPGDVVEAIDGAPVDVPLPSAGDKETTDRIVSVEERIARAGADGQLSLAVSRDGARRIIDLQPRMGCASRYEVMMARGLDAQADGSVVQIAVGMVEAARNEDELAVVLAHELAHNVLRHRARLDAAGISRGALAGFGRNVGYIRRSEIEADMLGIVLLTNAGYDVEAPARFWRWFGPRHNNSIFLSRTHPSWSTRASVYDREAAKIVTISARPFSPPILAERDKPITNDWRALLR